MGYRYLYFNGTEISVQFLVYNTIVVVVGLTAVNQIALGPGFNIIEFHAASIYAHYELAIHGGIVVAILELFDQQLIELFQLFGAD